MADEKMRPSGTGQAGRSEQLERIAPSIVLIVRYVPGTCDELDYEGEANRRRGEGEGELPDPPPYV
jgi:hypothetical protein